ncbi:F0F1 ATP synthase subunit B [Allorhizobium taibaishanense]|uniref:ATP synthase subunit b n=1 Tax=Allorhizobium taibaishanense TaxID=887144 RepID=A0A1Q9AA87_9HYPH|nr:F0F1 ATP synthase subunit B [Allorhizobium taibaishanense]MBB4006951.1 F-type H+-transporting ATPase subunit b [Allorhizobium taibaishanense]OLP51779.1 ATP F0F1 synthase subunit B' [Allorhizobium taibaishanense]
MFVTPAYAEDVPAAAETHTETGVPHDAGHVKGVFPPFDHSTFASQLLWLVISFGLFYIVMQRVIVPRVGGILKNRHDRIAQDVDEASRLKAEADAEVETYEKELSAAKAKGHQIASEAREAAKAKAAADRAAVEAELAQKIAAAEAGIAALKTKAFAEVDAIATETVAAIVEQLTGANVSAAEAQSAVVAGKRG